MPYGVNEPVKQSDIDALEARLDDLSHEVERLQDAQRARTAFLANSDGIAMSEKQRNAIVMMIRALDSGVKQVVDDKLKAELERALFIAKWELPQIHEDAITPKAVSAQD